MSNLNWVDYFFVAIFLVSVLTGFLRGFIGEVIALITLIAAFVIAILFSNALAAYFTDTAVVQSAVNQASTAIGMSASQPVSYIALGISFALIFVAVIIIGAIVRFILNLAFRTGILGVGNRLLGALFGLIRGYLLNLVIIFVLQLTSIGDQTWWHQSRIVVAYQPAVQWLGGVVSPSLSNLKSKFEQTVQQIGSQIQSRL